VTTASGPCSASSPPTSSATSSACPDHVGTRWAAFVEAAPEIASAAAVLFDRYELVTLATNTRSGHPRLSLVEPRILEGDLVIGATAGDAKSTDLGRDPRCSLHCMVSHRAHDEAEVKAALVAVELTGARLAAATGALARPEIRWEPTVAFELQVERAALVRRGDLSTWRDPAR
jgi:hypothetical protein